MTSDKYRVVNPYWDKMDKYAKESWPYDEAEDDPRYWRYKDEVEEEIRQRIIDAAEREISSDLTSKYSRQIQQLNQTVTKLELDLNSKNTDISKLNTSIAALKALIEILMPFLAHKDTCLYLDKLSAGRKIVIDEEKDCNCGFANIKKMGTENVAVSR